MLVINDKLVPKELNPQGSLAGFPNVVAVVLFKEDFADTTVSEALPLIANRFCPGDSRDTPVAGREVIQATLGSLFRACELRQGSGNK